MTRFSSLKYLFSLVLSSIFLINNRFNGGNMKNRKLKNVVRLLSTIVPITMISICSHADTHAGNDTQALNQRDVNESTTKKPHSGKVRRVIQGIVATGLNDSWGEPVFDFGEPYGPFHFASMGIYNPNGNEPLPLSKNVSDSDILATAVHPVFLALARKTRADVKPEWENIPLRDVPVNTDFSYTNTDPAYSKSSVLRSIKDANPVEVSQAKPSFPITVGDWKKARGVVTIDCESDNFSTLKVKVKDMIPNRLYSVGATLGGPFLSPLTIGGAPNLITTDKNGYGSLERQLNFCPLTTESAPRPVLVINVAFSSVHQAFGSVPEPVFIDGYWLGMVTHNHLQFPVNVTRLDD